MDGTSNPTFRDPKPQFDTPPVPIWPHEHAAGWDATPETTQDHLNLVHAIKPQDPGWLHATLLNVHDAHHYELEAEAAK